MRDKGGKRISFKKIVAWFFTIVFLVASLGAMSMNILFGLVMLMFGLALCPPISKLLNEKIGSTKLRRLRICLVIALFLVSIAISPNEGDIGVETNSKNTSAPEMKEEKKEKTVNKETVKNLDSEIWEAILESEEANNKLLELADAYDEGRLDRASLYENCQIAKDIQGNVYSRVSKINCEGIDEYRGACLDYVLCSRSFADNLQKYINKGDLKKLTKAKDNLSYAEDAIIKIAAGRTVFLEKSGFTTDEITKLLEK